MPISRRAFLKTAAAGTAAQAVGARFPRVASAGVLGANDAIHLGIIGLGVRGAGEHLPRFASIPGVRVVALADPDRLRHAPAVKALEQRFKQKAETYVDMRRIFDRKDVHCVSSATMNYWHALSTIWACKAGKHVYCEKPLSHFIWEGRQMVDAARKYDRLVQVGTQQRSRRATIDAVAWIRAGHLGKIESITCFANKPRISCGKRTTPLPIPKTLDYDLWCGPARKEPVYRDRLQYDCSFTWNMGDGESSNQGVHEIDVARWILGETGLPRRVMSIGGRFVFDDACDVPNTQIIYYDFASAPILYEVHNLRAAKNSNAAPTTRSLATGLVVDCEGGTLSIAGGVVAADKSGKTIKTFHGGEDHFANFIQAVRSGKREDLHADVLEGHLSTRIGHVGNISHRLGKPASVENQRKAVQDVPQAVQDVPRFAQMHQRLLEHLAAHEVDPNTATLGPWLECDTENECIKGNDEANRIVRGFYREPYVLPDVT